MENFENCKKVKLKIQIENYKTEKKKIKNL